MNKINEIKEKRRRLKNLLTIAVGTNTGIPSDLNKLRLDDCIEILERYIQ